MPKVKFTHRSIESFTAGEWLTDFWDDSLANFGIRVHQTGRKVYFVRYFVDGTRRRHNFGTYPAMSLADARDRAKELIGRLAKGEDPQAERHAERKAETFGELAAEYIENHAKRNKRSWHEDERIIQANLLPVWKNRKAKNITRRDLAEVLDTIVARNAPVMANRTKALISKIYNYGLSRDIVTYNPCFGVPMPTKARQRDRVLSEAEIRAFWRALDHVEPVMAATFRMRLLTAQRGLEVLSMRWEQIRDGWWTIPPEVAKNGLAHRVPIVPQVEELLSELRKHTAGSVWVFASPRKRGARITTITRAAMRIAEAAGIEGFTAHDLRRTAASHMTAMEIPRLVVAKILNHAESGITAVYDRHTYDREKREALVRWANKLEQILAGSLVTSDAG